MLPDLSGLFPESPDSLSDFGSTIIVKGDGEAGEIYVDKILFTTDLNYNPNNPTSPNSVCSDEDPNDNVYTKSTCTDVINGANVGLFGL